VSARSHEFAIAGERFVPRNGCQQFRNARLPFGRVLRVARMKVVVTSSRVRVHEQQAFVLARERMQHFEQQNVLVDVGKITGVVLVTIFHGTQALDVATLYTLPGGWPTHPQAPGRALTASASWCA